MTTTEDIVRTSAAIATVGSRMRFEPSQWSAPWPRSLQYRTSADGVTWGAWTDCPWLVPVDVTYPGYVQIRMTIQKITDGGTSYYIGADTVDLYNYKADGEADAVTSLVICRPTA